MASRLLRMLRLKRVLGLISLQTATELVSLFLVLNKFTGVYGLLAILTGYKLSVLQLLTYIYSIGVLGLIVYLLPHIRRQTRLECLALAWVYGIDTLVNIACTIAFGAYWFTGGDAGSLPRVPESDNPNEVTTPRIGPADTIASLVLIATFTLLRVYLSLVVASYAQHALQLASESDHGEEQRGDARLFPSPFASGSIDGDGWRGKLGRALVSVGRNYWLQRLDDDAWTQDVQARFRTTSGPSGTAGEIG